MANHSLLIHPKIDSAADVYNESKISDSANIQRGLYPPPDKVSFNTAGFMDMDGLIKLVLFIILAVMPFYFARALSFTLLAGYLLIITLLSGIKMRTLLISASSYFIIVLIPYLFGLMIHIFISSVANGYAYTQESAQILLRLLRLFNIWFLSILYFQTTPMKTVLGLLDRFLFPLKLAGLPVQDYLKVVMCAVLELKTTGAELKESLAKSMRSVFGGEKGKFKFNFKFKFKLNIKALSQVIVSLIVNSFGQLDRVEKLVENVNPADLYGYFFRLTKREIIALSGLAMFTFLVILVEKGYL